MQAVLQPSFKNFAFDTQDGLGRQSQEIKAILLRHVANWQMYFKGRKNFSVLHNKSADF